MKRILFASVLMLGTTSLALGQLQEPAAEPGTSYELRGLTRIFVHAPGRDRSIQKKITETIRKKIPHLVFVSPETEAEIWLSLTLQRKYEWTPTAPNPNDGMVTRTELSNITFVADGRVLCTRPGNPLKLIKNFRRQGGDEKKLAADFANEFVQIYERANIGLTFPAAKLMRPRVAPVETASTRYPDAKETASVNNKVSPTDDVEVLRVDTNLVTINVSVIDREGRYIPTLSKDIFSVYDEDVKQELSFFATSDEPFTVALLIDTSYSVAPKLKDIVAAANTFVEQLRDHDNLMVITFDSDIRETVKMTRRTEAISQRLFIKPGGGGETYVYDAVAFTIKKRLNRVRGRKAIVLLTDAMSANGEYTYKGSIRDAEESGTLVYTIQFDSNDDAKFTGRSADRLKNYYRQFYEQGTAYLEELARKTGGRFYAADQAGDFSEAFASIVRELGSQYSLGYSPQPLPKKGERRRIKVAVNLPNVAVRARSDYIFTIPERVPASSNK